MYKSIHRFSLQSQITEPENSTMSTHDEDLDLLLSLQDRVLETPPGSPSNSLPHSPGYLSDEDSPRSRRRGSGNTDLSVFRDVVQDCLDYEPKPVEKATKSKISKDPQVEKFSGLRIRNQLFSPAELSERFSDIRFVRLSTIKNLLAGDTISGCWATIGVLTEKGETKISSIGQSYSIWKIGCLNKDAISLFLFGGAYQQNRKAQAGSVFALFNSTVRKENKGQGFSLSVSSPNQILRIGVSADYGVCEGKKDGTPCTAIINKRHGIYCQYHKSKTSQSYSTQRTELKGGNLRRAFGNPRHSEGIYMFDPLADRTNSKKATEPVKLLSIEGLKRALRKADKVTTSSHSQGIRFLTEVAGKMGSKDASRSSTMSGQQSSTGLENRKSSIPKEDLLHGRNRNQQLDVKRRKTENGQALKDNPTQSTAKMIELDIISSEDEI